MTKVCTQDLGTKIRKWAVLGLPTVALFTLGCASVQPVEPTPDWQPTREALQKEREELRAKAAAREHRMKTAMEKALGEDSRPANEIAQEEVSHEGGDGSEKPQVLTPTQIFKLLDQGEITEGEAKRLLETYQEVYREDAGLEEDRPQ